VAQTDENFIPLFTVIPGHGHTITDTGSKVKTPHDTGEYYHLHTAGIDQLSEREFPVPVGVLYQGNVKEGGYMEFKIKQPQF
jgi:hypothetical protein